MAAHYHKKSHKVIVITLCVVVFVLLLISVFLAYEKYVMSVPILDNIKKSVCQSLGIPESEIQSATLSFKDDEQSTNDTFTLKDGVADLYDNNIGPRSYTLATHAQGDVNSDGKYEAIIGLYKGWGANRITPVIFATAENNGKLLQLDYVLPDRSEWKDETVIQSISTNNDIITVNLLVLSDADKSLPHYQQNASIPVAVNYRLINGKLTAI